MCAALSNVGRLAVCEITDRIQSGRRPHVPKVGLVDPIALSKDRKKAPLSAPS